MHRFPRTFVHSILALAMAQALPAVGADAELDALSLEAAPEPTVQEISRDTQVFLEGALGTASQRYQLGSRNLWRASLDITHAARLGPGWRGVVSNRVDHVYPADSGLDATVNSLREAYLSWQPGVGDTIIEFGRINLRYGPAYGYNPTDFFRDGSLRVLTTINPFSLRENRLGTVMVRGQRIWSGGSLSVAFSPKLADQPSQNGWNLDLGATNNRSRALVALGGQFSQGRSGQALFYKEDGRSPTVGANFTALLSDAAVAHAEWSRGSEPDLLNRALATQEAEATRNRFAGGVTYTTLGKLSLTAEYQYNGFALDKASWSALAASPATQVAYLRESLRRQDLAPRQAYLIYVTQKNFGFNNLDLTAFLRINAEDNSRLAWAELRHHWPSFDLSMQWQQYMGNPGSEFGTVADRRVLQVLGNYYF